MAGIQHYGAYVPRLRLQRAAIYQANRWFAPGLRGLAKGERAIANWVGDFPSTAFTPSAAGSSGGSVPS